MVEPKIIRPLRVKEITPENFQPFGQVIGLSPDGKPFDQEDAQLILDRGTPRFYIMRLTRKGCQFNKITRHLQCTQCLGALAGKEWFLAVAPPSNTEQPAIEMIQAFRIPGNCFIKLHLGTWHAGPYFQDEFVDFYNLELADTNINDHDTWDLEKAAHLTFKIVD